MGITKRAPEPPKTQAEGSSRATSHARRVCKLHYYAHCEQVLDKSWEYRTPINEWRFEKWAVRLAQGFLLKSQIGVPGFDKLSPSVRCSYRPKTNRLEYYPGVGVCRAYLFCFAPTELEMWVGLWLLQSFRPYGTTMLLHKIPSKISNRCSLFDILTVPKQIALSIKGDKYLPLPTHQFNVPWPKMFSKSWQTCSGR